MFLAEQVSRIHPHRVSSYHRDTPPPHPLDHCGRVDPVLIHQHIHLSSLEHLRDPTKVFRALGDIGHRVSICITNCLVKRRGTSEYILPMLDRIILDAHDVVPITHYRCNIAIVEPVHVQADHVVNLSEIRYRYDR